MCRASEIESVMAAEEDSQCLPAVIKIDTDDDQFRTRYAGDSDSSCRVD
jgi:hypothetical protein